MVREFLVWWLGQLADWLPEGWRRFGPSGADGTVIAPAAPLAEPADSVILSLRRNGRETPLGRVRLDRGELPEISRARGKSVILRLDAADVLGKTLVLPLAAEHQLDQALVFEMDRETPFAADEVFWNRRVMRRDRHSGQLWVRLMLVPKERLAALLQALDEAGLRPRRVEIAGGPDHGELLPLDIDGHRAADGARRWLLWPAVACCAALALVASALPFARQQLALTAVERQLAADRSGAAEAQKLRQEIERLAGSAHAVEAEQAKGGRPLAVLAALTRLLPSNTYLTDFAQQQGKVTLTGQSSSASRLIALLATSELLRNPTFAAPVTRIAANQREIFTITAEVVP